MPPGQLAAERATVCELWQTVLQDGTIAQAEVK
ncbi:glutamate-ammonia-ligase adenylyltransferase [Bordetella pertussis]|nr:glutamate-ammonia-ligase adenylyltransferase [Bordetella pertussis]CFT86885.1 glutamate-ammonia-ligase adenylyltransferase [Bordetella pertussis]CFV95274.1 glutamate-ammonia-ligase adenylyltransferase [Bordetella pertussis]CPL01949.1 glutamate-ammonia-ligase adenylyltransferase [Bordetella pertussis]CPM69801.1 glutamate-ammonia-ligase adenylyltransferase [Bordetella pertussis]